MTISDLSALSSAARYRTDARSASSINIGRQFQLPHLLYTLRAGGSANLRHVAARIPACSAIVDVRAILRSQRCGANTTN